MCRMHFYVRDIDLYARDKIFRIQSYIQNRVVRYSSACLMEMGLQLVRCVIESCLDAPSPASSPSATGVTACQNVA